jgi:hypothetical protein
MPAASTPPCSTNGRSGPIGGDCQMGHIVACAKFNARQSNLMYPASTLFEPQPLHASFQAIFVISFVLEYSCENWELDRDTVWAPSLARLDSN